MQERAPRRAASDGANYVSYARRRLIRRYNKMAQSLWRRFWHFIWVEDSAASWIANVILAFIIIKFLVYPGLGFAFGTTHPIVAVVSGSMEHDGSFDQWWAGGCGAMSQESLYTSYDLGKSQFKEFPHRNGFNKGDIMILLGADDPKIGEVIVYSIKEQPDPIIHRVVGKSMYDGHNVYKTKGDHNCGVNPFEEQIEPDQVIGRAVVRVPLLGWVKLAFMQLVWWIAALFG